MPQAPRKPPCRVQVLRRVDAFECQHIATTAWVFAQYDWAPQDALQALSNEAERRGPGMRPQHISMLLQVLAPSANAACKQFTNGFGGILLFILHLLNVNADVCLRASVLHMRGSLFLATNHVVLKLVIFTPLRSTPDGNVIAI